jgi:predicted CXXCH cytochrome family protein
MKDGGSSLMSFGHLDARASLAGGIDSFSIQCMSCHESLSAGLNVRVSEDVIRHDGSQISHPIGMRYEKSALYGGYRPVPLLPQEIVLPDGKVSCISCHQGYSDKHGKLVMDNTGSRLCFSCHDI